MITLHRLNGDEFTLNDKHIEIIEEKPDTIVTLTNERKYIVRESVREIVDRIAEFNAMVFRKINIR